MSIALIVLNFIRQNWFIITICMAILSIFAYIKILQNDITILKTDLIISEAKLTTCNDTIETRNKVIQDWSSKTDEQSNRMLSLSSDIKKLTRTTNNKIKFILQQNQPKTCDEAMEYFVNIGKKYE